MCLTTPGEIRTIATASADGRVAAVDFGASVRSVNLLFTPEAKVGDFVIVHAGYATRIVPFDEAREALAYARELAATAAAEVL